MQFTPQKILIRLKLQICFVWQKMAALIRQLTGSFFNSFNSTITWPVYFPFMRSKHEESNETNLGVMERQNSPRLHNLNIRKTWTTDSPRSKRTRALQSRHRSPQRNPPLQQKQGHRDWRRIHHLLEWPQQWRTTWGRWRLSHQRPSCQDAWSASSWIVFWSTSSKATSLKVYVDSAQAPLIWFFFRSPAIGEEDGATSGPLQDIRWPQKSIRQPEHRGTVEDHVQVWLPGQVREDHQAVSWRDDGPSAWWWKRLGPVSGDQWSKTWLRSRHYAFQADILGDADGCLQGDFPWHPHQVKCNGKLSNSWHLQAITKVKDTVIRDLLQWWWLCAECRQWARDATGDGRNLNCLQQVRSHHQHRKDRSDVPARPRKPIPRTLHHRERSETPVREELRIPG